MFADNAWYITSEGEATMVTEGMHYDSYGQSSPYLDNANLENCWCVTAEYEEFYGYVGLGDLRHNSYGRISPSTSGAHYAYFVRSSGDVDYYDYVHDNSYGNLLRQSYIM